MNRVSSSVGVVFFVLLGCLFPGSWAGEKKELKPKDKAKEPKQEAKKQSSMLAND